VKLPGVLTMAGIGCLLGAAAFVITGPAGDQGYVPSGRSGDPADLVTPPTGVRLPGGEERIKVVPISPEESGTLEPPSDVERAGWWRGGAAIGDGAGTVVLAGHVDAAEQGLGSFAPLWRTKPGQTVHLRGKDGRDVAYTITGTRVYPRTKALPPEVFDTGGAPKLALITCAGTFDRKAGHYSDTLVVYAVPKGAST
jgi:hypothetical protein